MSEETSKSTPDDISNSGTPPNSKTATGTPPDSKTTTGTQTTPVIQTDQPKSKTVCTCQCGSCHPGQFTRPPTPMERLCQSAPTPVLTPVTGKCSNL